jgi:hypothetical protein
LKENTQEETRREDFWIGNREETAVFEGEREEGRKTRMLIFFSAFFFCENPSYYSLYF